MATGELKGFIDMELKYGDLAPDQMNGAYNNLRRLESGAYYMAKHPEMKNLNHCGEEWEEYDCM